MRSPGAPLKHRQEQEMERETGSARRQGPHSEQPDPVQVLLTPSQEEEEDQAAPRQDSALGQDPTHPGAALVRSSPHPCEPCREVEQDGGVGKRGEEGEAGREGVGVRLCELLQVGGVSVRPLGRHLAISLPSLPLRLWDPHGSHLEPLHTHPPPPSSPPPPPSSVESSGPSKPFTPLWQPPRPHSSATAAPPWPPDSTPHWSSWSLDGPNAVVTPYDTPPDRCIPIQTQTSGQHASFSCQSSPGHYSSQHALGRHSCDHEEAELSELDSLYQASLLAGRTGCSPSERLISRVGGQARSKTPNADMERSAYGADCTRSPAYLNKVTSMQPMALQDFRLGAEPDDGENPRRIGRSLSGTVVASRRGRLTATRSFVKQADVSPLSLLTSSFLSPCCSSTTITSSILLITNTSYHHLPPPLHRDSQEATPPRDGRSHLEMKMRRRRRRRRRR
ncbi:uncharacterized protein isoform X1 [Takifugu rubripes]|uniref:uncharacterized protein isoform X1 n=1 Tax=Takifugu rubripes TaxID=31033 RepID=UPI0011455963|nr:uncharacterized protein LOC115251505 isoform X1 [Takifugu rubripes]